MTRITANRHSIHHQLNKCVERRNPALECSGLLFNKAIDVLPSPLRLAGMKDSATVCMKFLQKSIIIDQNLKLKLNLQKKYVVSVLG